jgi:hypothetical protein
MWARAHGCPWSPRTCYVAARAGRLAVLQWARAHGCRWSKRACEEDSQNHFKTWDWVRRQPE